MKKPGLAYAEQCLAWHEEIARGQFIADQKPASGWGGGFTFSSYGQVVLQSGETIYVGQKRPNKGRSTRVRLVNELIIGSILVDRCPSLLDQLPKFVGWGGEPGHDYVLTEDLSRGGTVEVESFPASAYTRDLLRAGFAKYGEYKMVIDGDGLEYTTSFWAEGEEKMLDLTPSPYFYASDQVEADYPPV